MRTPTTRTARIAAGTAALAAIVVPGIATAGVSQPERNIQIRSVDLDTSVLEVHNFGATLQPLDGWRFCSHSNAQARRYTGTAALNGVSIAPGGSLYIHMDNDAPAEPGRFNAADLGSFASNFGQGPYAVQLFWPNGGSLSFGDNDDMVDHAQWSVMGVNNPVAQTRSQQATDAGLWTGATDWIVTTGNTQLIELIPMGGELHGPADYALTEPPVSCGPADIGEPLGVLDLADIQAFITGFTGQDPIADLAAPAGVFDLQDIQAFITAFAAGCP